MKIKRCSKCGRTQQSGNYCLDCGQKLEEVVTSHVQFKKMSTNRTADHLKRDVRNWLGRIGVQQPDIIINTSNGASIQYTLAEVVYTFSSVLQDNITNNLAAVEQFLHHRVIGIERGIETIEQAFKGYEALPSPEDLDPYRVLGLHEEADRTVEKAKVQFKILARKYHPDINKNENARSEFERIKIAIDMIEKDATNTPLRQK